MIKIIIGLLLVLSNFNCALLALFTILNLNDSEVRQNLFKDYPTITIVLFVFGLIAFILGAYILVRSKKVSIKTVTCASLLSLTNFCYGTISGIVCLLLLWGYTRYEKKNRNTQPEKGSGIHL